VNKRKNGIRFHTLSTQHSFVSQQASYRDDGDPGNRRNRNIARARIRLIRGNDSNDIQHFKWFDLIVFGQLVFDSQLSEHGI